MRETHGAPSPLTGLDSSSQQTVPVTRAALLELKQHQPRRVQSSEAEATTCQIQDACRYPHGGHCHIACNYRQTTISFRTE